MKTITATILDAVFTAILGFFLSIVILGYLLRPPFSIIFSIILSLIFTVLFVKYSLSKNNKEKLNSADRKAKEIMSTQLKLYTLTEQNDFLEKVIKSSGNSVERKKGGLFIKNKDLAVFCFYSYDQIRKTDVVKVFNSISKTQKAFILSDTFPSEVKEFADRFDGRIITVNDQKLYAYLNEKNLLPKAKHLFSERKKYDFSQFKNLLKKKKAKNFLAFGLIFLLTSYFVPIKTYYVICGTLFLIFSLVLHVYGQTENKEQNSG